MKTVSLSSVIDIISGGTPKTDVEEYWKGGNIGWLSVTDFNNDQKYVYETEKKITEKGLNNSNTKLLQKDDIIISARGTVGALSMIGKPMCFNQSCFGIRGKRGIVDNTFLYYYLKNYVQHVKKRSQGSVFDTINLASFDMMDVDIPKLETQKKIASVLSALDSKIELNNRINTTLEQMAKTLYDYWFVQFDFPNKNGKPYKSSGGKMVWSEELKREIPEGWEVNSLSNYITIERGISYKGTELGESGIPMINLNSFHLDGRFKFEGTKYFTGVVNRNKQIKTGDLMVATTDVTRNAYIIGKSFILPDLFKDQVVASCDIAKLNISEKLDKYYLDMLFNSNNYHKYIKGFASGTLVLHLDTSGIGWYKAIIPPKDLLNKYALFKENIDSKKTLTFKENQQLSQLRDWLLPMLMNGQVKVGETIRDNTQQQVQPSTNVVAEPLLLFDASPIQNAVDLQLAIVLKVLNRKKGDTMMQKDAFNLLALNGGVNPLLKAYKYDMHNFGTYSEQLKKDIGNNPFISKLHNGVYWLNPTKENEVKKAIKLPENQHLVQLAGRLKELYAKPFINNNFDKIELLNTVLKLTIEYKTNDPKIIYNAMKSWRVELGKYKTKAEKFSYSDTGTMLKLLVNKGIIIQ
ncbi:MAG: restriction endonuclease subunit S [Bacteroidota bacterium]